MRVEKIKCANWCFLVILSPRFTPVINIPEADEVNIKKLQQSDFENITTIS